MRVVLNGVDGQVSLTLTEGAVISEHTNKPFPLLTYKDRLYDYAGTQDGAHFYRERRDVRPG